MHSGLKVIVCKFKLNRTHVKDEKATGFFSLWEMRHLWVRAPPIALSQREGQMMNMVLVYTGTGEDAPQYFSISIIIL